MKPTLLSVLSVIIVLAAHAQDPQIEWQNTIGGSGFDYLYSIQQTADGGYILGGYSNSGISGDKTEAAQDYDYWVIKLDIAGNIVWQNTIGGSGNDMLRSVQQTTDGGYILGGSSRSGISGDKTEASQGFSDYWVIKIDGAGNIVWQNTIGGGDSDGLNSIQQTADGGYILGGSSISGISGDKTEANFDTLTGTSDYWVIKLDSTGNIVWQNTIGGSSSDVLYSIQQTADGGFILGGWTDSGISGDKTEASHGDTDYWVVKLDTAGNIAWQNTIGGSSYDHLNSIWQTADGGYVLGGSSASGVSGDKTESSLDTIFYTSDFWVIKLDSAGNIVWQNTIGGDGYDRLLSILQTADGGYILGGNSESGISGDKTEAYLDTLGFPVPTNDYWVIKLDAAGDIIWQNTIGGGDDDYSIAIQQTTDGSYIVGGYSLSGISADKTEAKQGNWDYWVIKLSDLHKISGRLRTEIGAPVPGAAVMLSGDDTLTSITDITGSYSFSVRPNGNYVIMPSKSNDVLITNGISSLDVLLMRRHILGIAPLVSPYKIIAAAESNAAGDSLVSTTDILLTRQMILGSANSYPTNRLWQFVPSDYVFADPTNPFPFPNTRTYTNITTNQTSQDFIGIKLGDVNNSWDPNTP